MSEKKTSKNSSKEENAVVRFKETLRALRFHKFSGKVDTKAKREARKGVARALTAANGKAAE